MQLIDIYLSLDPFSYTDELINQVFQLELKEIRLRNFDWEGLTDIEPRLILFLLEDFQDEQQLTFEQRDDGLFTWYADGKPIKVDPLPHTFYQWQQSSRKNEFLYSDTSSIIFELSAKYIKDKVIKLAVVNDYTPLIQLSDSIVENAINSIDEQAETSFQLALSLHNRQSKDLCLNDCNGNG